MDTIRRTVAGMIVIPVVVSISIAQPGARPDTGAVGSTSPHTEPVEIVPPLHPAVLLRANEIIQAHALNASLFELESVSHDPLTDRVEVIVVLEDMARRKQFFIQPEWRNVQQLEETASIIRSEMHDLLPEYEGYENWLHIKFFSASSENHPFLIAADTSGALTIHRLNEKTAPRPELPQPDND